MTKKAHETQRLYAWVGEDEHGSGRTGIKKGQVPAGFIPLVVMDFDRHKIERLRPAMEEQAKRYGKKIRLVEYSFSAVIEETEAGS